MLITAALTIKTDTAERKIYNSHLRLVGILTLLAYLIVFISREPPISYNNFIINCALSLSIGFAFYFKDMWRAGDAKLFFIYSLLIATKKTGTIINVPCVELFFNMFLLGGLFLLPSIASATFKKRSALISGFSIKKIGSLLLKTLMVTIGLSWLIYPVLHIFEVKNNPFASALIIYLSFRLIFKAFNNIKSRLIGNIVFLAGIISRFIFLPESLTVYQIFIYLKSIIIFSVVYYPVRIFIETEKEKTNRVPFAPFMFLGAAISYTGFLNFCMRLITAITQ